MWTEQTGGHHGWPQHPVEELRPALTLTESESKRLLIQRPANLMAYEIASCREIIPQPQEELQAHVHRQDGSSAAACLLEQTILLALVINDLALFRAAHANTQISNEIRQVANIHHKNEGAARIG